MTSCGWIYRDQLPQVPGLDIHTVMTVPRTVSTHELFLPEIVYGWIFHHSNTKTHQVTSTIVNKLGMWSVQA